MRQNITIWKYVSNSRQAVATKKGNSHSAVATKKGNSHSAAATKS